MEERPLRNRPLLIRQELLPLLDANCVETIGSVIASLPPQATTLDPRLLGAQVLLLLGKKRESFLLLDKIDADPAAQLRYRDIVLETGDTINNCFVINGEKLSYFIAHYNHTWRNERIVEIPFAKEFLNNNRGAEILEIGNVMSHYFAVSHDIVDKYEPCDGVINSDILTYTPAKKYDAILSLSTLEHIGKDKVRDDRKVLRVYDHIMNELLSDTGVFMFSVPIGFNPVFDAYIDRGEIKPDAAVCLKRISADNDWVEVSWNSAKTSKYMDPYHCANALYFGFAYGKNHHSRKKAASAAMPPALTTPKGPVVENAPAAKKAPGPSRGRVESNTWLRAAAATVTGKVLSIGSRDDSDGEGGSYRAYFSSADSYTTSDVAGPVDLRLDARNMASLADHHYSGIFCSGVLEHVDDFKAALNEITRILAPGGTLLLGLPFRQAIHDEPLDFWRFTRYAIDYLLKDRYVIHEIKEIDTETEKFPVAYWVKAVKK
jgi:hypothetical protein